MKERNKRTTGVNVKAAAGPGGDKSEVENFDNQALYFLTIILLMVVTFSLFKSEILYLIFSTLLP